jgi:hypothetical protein
MTALAAALLVALVPQDEARLKESWPKLVEAWKAVEACKAPAETAMLDDELLKVAAKLHAAFDAAGLFAAESEYLPQAVKALIKIRTRSILPAASTSVGQRFAARVLRMGAGGGFEVSPADANPMGALLASLKKLQALKKDGLDDEENVQDELSTARKALKSIGITADDTPPGLRRRALHLVKAMALGEDYPAAAVATDDQAKQYRLWITDLGNESIEARETAAKELMRAGESVLPFAREAMKSPDAEVVTRARSLLGFGHAPWTKLKVQEPEGWSFDVPMVLPAPVAPPPAPAPKEEKPK